MARLRIISPHFTNEKSRIAADVRAYLAQLAQGQHEISYVTLRVGPSSIENELDAALAVPGILEQVVQAEKDGVDAVIVSCFGDPGVGAARTVGNILVFGPGQTSMHAAALLGHRFSVISVAESVRPMIENNSRLYGLTDKLASIRVIDIPVLQMLNDTEALNQALAKQAILAVRQDKADVIVLGCTGFLGTAEAVKAILQAQQIYVPVIDPLPTTIAIAQAISGLKLAHDPLLYTPNLHKPTKGYEVLFDSLQPTVEAKTA